MKRDYAQQELRDTWTVPPDPSPAGIDAWGLGDCLEFLGIEGEALDELFECLSWQTKYDILEDLRRQCRKEW